MIGKFHSLPYPCLEEGNLSYPNGTYQGVAKSKEEGKSAKLTHELKDAHFIEQQIKKKKAQFGCILSGPSTGYRKMFLSSSSDQELDCDVQIIGDRSMIRTFVVAIEKISHTFTAHDGVADIWIGQRIDIPKGARLARDVFWYSTPPSMQSMLKFKGDSSLLEGTFFVSEDVTDGYKFLVRVAPNLLEFLRNRSSDYQLRRSIETHITSSCFAILHRKFGHDNLDADWAEYDNLRMLRDIFVENGITLWSDSEFRPEQAATTYHPLIFPERVEEEE